VLVVELQCLSRQVRVLQPSLNVVPDIDGVETEPPMQTVALVLLNVPGLSTEPVLQLKGSHSSQGERTPKLLLEINIKKPTNAKNQRISY